MNTSGEAADQVMRMMLNGTEVLLKVSGAGAKHTAVLLYSVLRQQQKTSGAARLSSMLRSGKALKVYTFRDNDLQKFKQHAKEYGVLFCILKDKDKTDGVFDVLVRAEDAAKLTRIIERFKLTQVDATEIKSEIVKDLEAQKKDAEKGTEEKPKNEPEAEKETETGEIPPEAEISTGVRTRDDDVSDALLGESEEAIEPDRENPTPARTEDIPNEVEEVSEREEPRDKAVVNEAGATTLSESTKPDGSRISTDISEKENGKDRFDRSEPVRARLQRIRKKRELRTRQTGRGEQSIQKTERGDRAR